MMSLTLLRLLLDFGMLVLIWLVQLVIYPSFEYYQREDLLSWHVLYTKRITYVVLPLMLGQLILSGLQLWYGLTWYTGGSFLIILALWGATFLQFVPLHQNITLGNFDPGTIRQLVQKNWLRTVLWTFLFAMSLIRIMR